MTFSRTRVRGQAEQMVREEERSTGLTFISPVSHLPNREWKMTNDIFNSAF
jgi:hypothetical protein